MKKITNISELHSAKRNARDHGQRNLDMIEQSLKDYGAARSIVIDEKGEIIAGHGTVTAAVPTFTVFADGIEKSFRIKAPKGCESARFCRVTWNRRSVVLQQTAVSPKTIKGVTMDGIPTTIFLRKGVKVQPLAASCEGTLVPVKLACRCNNGAALAVEHGKGWAA